MGVMEDGEGRREERAGRRRERGEGRREREEKEEGEGEVTIMPHFSGGWCTNLMSIKVNDHHF